MTARREYEMTEADLAALLEACKPVPLIAIHTGMPASPQLNANRAWQQLGWKMGFNYLTVKPIAGKGQRFFTAEPLTIVKEARDGGAGTVEAAIDRHNKAIDEERRRLAADSRIVYGVGCTWWDDIYKIAKTPPLGPGRASLPCCPHCRGLLLEVPNMDAWMKNAPAYEADGHPGYVEMLKWSRGRCFKTAAELKEAYKAETGIDVP